MPEVVVKTAFWSQFNVPHSLDYKASLDSTICFLMLDWVDMFLIIFIMLLCKSHLFTFIKDQPTCNVL